MVIDTSNTVKTNTPSNGRASATTGGVNTAKNPAQNSPSPARGDSVALSPEAQTLGQLRQAIDNASGIDSERVNTIKQAIAEGRFEINPERLAEAMLAQEKLLG